MRMCQRHWDAVKEALRARGLTWASSAEGLIARDGSILATDPLMGAHNAIVSNAIDFIGLPLFAPNPDGSEKCPLCFLISSCNCGNTTCAERFENWINLAADDQLETRMKSDGPSS